MSWSEVCRCQSEASAHALYWVQILLYLFLWHTLVSVGLSCWFNTDSAWLFFPPSLPTATKQPTLKCSNGQMIWPNSESNLKVSSRYWCTFGGQLDSASFKFDVRQQSCHCHILKKKNYPSSPKRPCLESKLKISEEDLGPVVRQRSNTLPKSFGSQLEKDDDKKQDLSDKSAKPAVEATLDSIQKKLQEKRTETNRPEDIKVQCRQIRFRPLSTSR